MLRTIRENDRIESVVECHSTGFGLNHHIDDFVRGRIHDRVEGTEQYPDDPGVALSRSTSAGRSSVSVDDGYLVVDSGFLVVDGSFLVINGGFLVANGEADSPPTSLIVLDILPRIIVYRLLR